MSMNHFQGTQVAVVGNLWCNILDSHVTTVDDNVGLGSYLILPKSYQTYEISAFYG